MMILERRWHRLIKVSKLNIHIGIANYAQLT